MNTIEARSGGKQLGKEFKTRTAGRTEDVGVANSSSKDMPLMLMMVKKSQETNQRIDMFGNSPLDPLSLHRHFEDN